MGVMTTISATGFLFDSDGVLVDSLEAAAQAWDAWALEHAPSYNFRTDMVHGTRAGDIVAGLVTADLFVEAERALLDAELATVDGTVAIAGAIALTASLPAGSWTVVTSAAHDLARARLAAAGLAAPASLVTAEDVSRGKPDPEPYRRGAELVGIDPAHCVVFEDAPAGIQAAFDAGIGTIIGVGASALGTQATLVVPDLTAVSYVDGALQVDDAAILVAA